MPNWLVILLAVLAPGGVLTVLLERLRRENNRDHNRNLELLHTIDRKVDGVSDRVDDHVRWHLDKGSDR
jgi:hypothetical protein